MTTHMTLSLNSIITLMTHYYICILSWKKRTMVSVFVSIYDKIFSLDDLPLSLYHSITLSLLYGTIWIRERRKPRLWSPVLPYCQLQTLRYHPCCYNLFICRMLRMLIMYMPSEKKKCFQICAMLICLITSLYLLMSMPLR